ncbi:C40 family peptidase [Anaerorudis cellulosivorans]|uniref:C40 family peptidase n=1 Tax=Anaerorudis cellulosivorans TaxID=3397862 RepID=UPI0022207037|nr:C40 family peptidase [Seramator thermalis]MCW1734753.1 C40 family peptidase [Seramator thermalis]
MQQYAYLSWFLFVTLSFSMAQTNDIREIIKSVEAKYIPDKRIEVFDIKAYRQKDTLILKGETTSHAAYNEVIAKAKRRFIEVKDSIRLLPDKKLGEETWGVIYNSPGTIYRNPKHSAEIVSQALLGTPVNVLEKKGGWRRIQTPDRYIGWINGSVKPMTKAALQSYLQQPKIIVTSLSAFSYEHPDPGSQTISDLGAGDMLIIKEEKGMFYRVFYPDGREAFVSKNDVQPFEIWKKSRIWTGEEIVKTAKRFMGIPYLWGGTSSKGLDCSGFTKLVYFLHGIILSRDASQQVLSGKLIDEKGDFENVQPGDLVFFGTKATDENPRESVVHVGIYIGNKRFIHASDYIQIGSFDSTDPFYDEYNTGRYLRTKRILGEINTPGIEEINKNAFYHPTE